MNTHTNTIQQEETTISIIIEEVAKEFRKHYPIFEGQNFKEMLSLKWRKQEVAEARQMCYYFMKEYTKCGLKIMGTIFVKHGQDHTTVLHGIAKINGLYLYDRLTKKMIDAIRAKLKQRLYFGDVDKIEAAFKYAEFVPQNLGLSC